MPMTRKQILTEAMELEPAEREILAEQLLVSVDGDEQQAVDAAWAAEADRRLEAYDRGEVTSRSPDEMFRRLREKFDS